ncbi:substrate-binding domain-containing protein [Streptomyces sp. NBC_01341]|uniref:substrate-binding domain-containing protein n=1 Tax=Streptomyces sp. NBC_01341 TaxID=2903831 RepID=UPI002E13FA96|nr:substrate-binding domain-containing protein [Streptomyces sp. NBC_01341]
MPPGCSPPPSSSATPLPDQVARRGHARRLPFPEPFGFVERIAVGQRQAVQDTTHQRRLPVRQFGAALPVDLPDTRGHVTRRQEPRVAAVDDGTAGGQRTGGGQQCVQVGRANDLLAIGAVNAATRLGVAVPDDLTIVGYDDIDFDFDFDETAGVALTTVRRPARAIGRQAAEILLREVTDGAAPTEPVFKPELVIRPSSLPVRAGVTGTTAGL